MTDRVKMERDTWSKDGQYLIRATASFLPDVNNRPIDIVTGFVVVFFGNPESTGNPAIFMSSTQSHSNDLLEQLREAEHLGRDYIDSVRSR